MSFKKIVFLAVFLAVFGGVFGVNIQPTKAATVEELQALIAQLTVQIAQLQQQLAEEQGQPSAWCHTFNISLRVGDQGEDARALRTALVKEGFSGLEAMGGAYSFDENLASAVVGFQQKYKEEILGPYGLQFGTGFVGSTTRAKLNSLYGCGAVQPAPTPVSITTPTPIPEPTPAPQSVSLTFRLLSPNGGEELFQGVSYPISWQTGGSLDRISIYLDKADVTQASDVIAENIPNSGSYAWTVRAAQRGSYKIRVCEWRDPATAFYAVTCDASDSFFNIAAAPVVAAPEMVSPANGQILNHGIPDGYRFKIKPVAGAFGYLFGFFQNGVMVYENWRDDRTLNKTGEFTIWPSNPFYSKIQAGDLQVWVRTWVNNQWSEARIITIKLVSSTVSIPSITILSPNGGESWKIGETHDITWSYSGPADKIIQIELGLPAADGLGIISNIYANTQRYSWQVPLDVPARSDYRVVIRETSPSYTLLDSSNNYFSIAPKATTVPSVTILSPNGGELWDPSQSYKISWTANGLLNSNVDIFVTTYDQNGNSTSGLKFIANVLAAQGYYYWAPGGVPLYLSSGTVKYKITVREASIAPAATSDLSDGYFSIVSVASVTPSIIVLSPNGGESLQIGSTYRVKWNAANMYNVKINIVNDTNLSSGSTNYITPYGNAWSASTGYYDWTITSQQLPVGTSSARYKIFISDDKNSSIVDSSDSYFTIVGATTTPSITSFNYTETDAYNGSVKFYWVNTGTDFVNLWVPCYSGVSIKNAVTGANFLCGESDLNLPSNSSIYLKFTNTSGALVNVTATLTPIAGSTTYGAYSRTLNFTLIPTAPSVEVVLPNGGEEWYSGGNVYNIAWSSINVNAVDIELADWSRAGAGGPLTWMIAKNIAPLDSSGNGKYSWNIPAPASLTPSLEPGSQYQIRVYNSTNYSVFDTSDAFFKIDFNILGANDLKNVENQLASVSDAAANLLVEIKKLLEK
ncbi:MAG: peptidoglycan-binding domain-containing protein [bacterium]|nr:peptidoglycan-binding domain-containing protein [bacterium]